MQITGESIELPVIWATSALEGPVRDIALAGGVGGTLAVAYESSGLQFFSLEGDRIAEIANYKVSRLARGFTVVLDDASMTLFPGIDQNGRLKAYLYGDGLLAPAEVELPIEDPRNAIGLCAMQGHVGGEALFHMAYWTTDNNRSLKTGAISVKDSEFVWTPSEPASYPEALTSCAYMNGHPVAAHKTVDAAHFVRGDVEAMLSIRTGGEAFLTLADGAHVMIHLRNGLSVSAPARPVAIGALGVPLSGGYPSGVIVLAGEVKNGEHQVVFVDPSIIMTRLTPDPTE